MQQTYLKGGTRKHIIQISIRNTFMVSSYANVMQVLTCAFQCDEFMLKHYTTP